MNPKQPRGELSVRSILAAFAILVLVIILAACAAATATPPSGVTAPPEATQMVPATAETPTVSEIPIAKCDVLLPPEACNPEWESQIVYTPLIDLPSADCEKRLLDDGAGRCVGLTYANNNQDFTITVEGADAATVTDYINTSMAYFIVQQVGGGVTPPTDLNLPSLPAILVETSTGYAKLTQAELSAERDRIVSERGVEGEYVTLADVLLAIPSGYSTIVDDVLNEAESRAGNETIAAGTAAGLSQTEIDGLTSSIQAELEALMYEPGASFLFDPAMLPLDETGQRNALLNNPTSLLITTEWNGAPSKETGDLWVVWYSIDPQIQPVSVSYAGTQIAATAVHNYQEKCKVTSASVRIQAVAGSMTNYFWRVEPTPTKFIGSKVADVRKTPAPTGLVHSSYPTKVKYDTKVVGGPLGGNYYIYGGWVQGSGCQ